MQWLRIKNKIKYYFVKFCHFFFGFAHIVGRLLIIPLLENLFARMVASINKRIKK